MLYLHTQLKCRRSSDRRYFILKSLTGSVCRWKIVQTKRFFMIMVMCARVHTATKCEARSCALTEFERKTVKWMFYDKRIFSLSEQWRTHLNETDARCHRFGWLSLLLIRVNFKILRFFNCSNSLAQSMRDRRWINFCLLIVLTTYQFKSRV